MFDSLAVNSDTGCGRSLPADHRMPTFQRGHAAGPYLRRFRTACKEAS